MRRLLLEFQVDNGGASEKSTQAESSKELCSPPPDPPECGTADTPAGGGSGGEVVSVGKGEAAQAVATPIAEG